MAAKPSIGMIGNGNVGSNLSKGLRDAGYPVQNTGNDPETVRRIAKESDILVLAVPRDAVRDVIGEMDGAHQGKILIDVTNLATKQGYGGSIDRSGAEELASWADGAKVVKAFNTVFAPHMVNGEIEGTPLSAFVAGDDEASRRIVCQMAADIGFDGVDAGPLENARWLETLGYLNITLGYTQNMGTDIGFHLLHPKQVQGIMEPAGMKRSG